MAAEQLAGKTQKRMQTVALGLWGYFWTIETLAQNGSPRRLVGQEVDDASCMLCNLFIGNLTALIGIGVFILLLLVLGALFTYMMKGPGRPGGAATGPS